MKENIKDGLITAGPCTLSFGAMIGAPTIIIVGLSIIAISLVTEVLS